MSLVVWDWTKIRQVAYKYCRFYDWRLTDHGPGHLEHVEHNADVIGALAKLPQVELDFLKAAVLLHDIGHCKATYEKHNIYSGKLVRYLSKKGELPFNEKQAKLVSLLCEWHRGQYKYDYSDEESGIRIGFLASILRIADAMDISYRRVRGYKKITAVLKPTKREFLRYWDAAKAIKGVRLICNERIVIQVLTDDPRQASENVNMLCDDIQSTPFPCSVELVTIRKYIEYKMFPKKRVLVFGHYDSHGIVASALSKKRLEQEGHRAEVICSLEQTGSISDFWGEIAPNFDVSAFDTVMVVDLPVDRIAPENSRRTIAGWVKNGVKVIVIDHHKATSDLITQLLGIGAEVWVTDTLSCFYGHAADYNDLFWARIGVICDRDVSSLPITRDEKMISNGLLKAVFDGNREIARRILKNDIQYFKKLGADFKIPKVDYEIFGRVLVLKNPPETTLKRVWYFPLEEAIDRHGVNELGKRKAPYGAILAEDVDVNGQKKDLILVIKYWGEDVIPPFFLFPQELRKHAVGHETAPWVSVDVGKGKHALGEIVESINSFYADTI